MKTTENAISVRNINKSFKLPHDNHSGIKQFIIGLFKKNRKKGYEIQHVLNDVSFDIKKGEFFGIVGRNGSGKSTLLKLISGIYTPDSGSIQINGSLVPFIELGVGFNPELSGRENVFLNGALLGFSKKEMEEMFDDIVSFAELEGFLDQKLKNYSSGMQVRLAFSIAIRSRSDILVLDEVLAVGDEAFQRKCNMFFEQVRKDKSKTVILVTHSMESVRKYCSRAILITEGSINVVGEPDRVASAYSDIFINERVLELQKLKKVKNPTIKQLSDITLQDVYVTQNNRKTNAVRFHKDFSLEIILKAEKDYKNLVMGVHFFDQSGRDMLAISTRTFGVFNLHKGENRVTFNIQNIFTDGDYHINLAVEDNNSQELLVQSHGISPFSIVGLDVSSYSKHSLTHPNVEAFFE